MNQPNRYKFKHVHSVSCEVYCRGEESCDCGAINQPHTLIKEDSVSAGKDPATVPTEPFVAGRELDARIAERVMGFDEVEHIGDLLYYHNAEMDRLSETGGRWRSPVPMYHSDIAAAMEVASSVIRKGWTFELRWIAVWMARFDSLASGKSEGYTAQDPATRPAEAICRAALAAVVAHNKEEK